MRKDFLDVLFPRECASCKKLMIKGEKHICTSCLYNLPKTNYWKDADNPVARLFWGRVYLENAASFLFFHKKSQVQEIIHALKYNKQKEIGAFLGEILGQELVNESFRKIDVIVPVPLHKKKLRKRGYNQSEWIANGLSKALNKPVECNALRQIAEKTSQTDKHRVERFSNVEKIFELNPIKDLENKHILLVDDVLTTGATIEVCAQELLKISGTKVSATTLAVAVI